MLAGGFFYFAAGVLLDAHEFDILGSVGGGSNNSKSMNLPEAIALDKMRFVAAVAECGMCAVFVE